MSSFEKTTKHPADALANDLDDHIDYNLPKTSAERQRMAAAQAMLRTIPALEAERDKWVSDFREAAHRVIGLTEERDQAIAAGAQTIADMAHEIEAMRAELAALKAQAAQPVATVLPEVLRRSPYDKDAEHWCHEALLYSPGSPHDRPEHRIKLYTAPQASVMITLDKHAIT